MRTGVVCTMPRYFFHVRQKNAVFADRQGAVFSDTMEALAWAAQDAYALTAQGTLTGRLADHWIEIGDELGATVAVLSFSRLVKDASLLRRQQRAEAREYVFH